ncbi:MAG: group III truncated hemoglobin [Acidiphilium sp.]
MSTAIITPPASGAVEDQRIETIDEAMIERVVHAFYARIRQDPLLGPIFEQRIHDWGTHLVQMCAFWSAVMLKTGRYHGTPMQKHMTLPVESDHFARWLDLFADTARSICPEEAPRFIAAARRIAQSLELGSETYRHKHL